MAIASISTLWSPAIWVDAMVERQAKTPVIVNSSAVFSSSMFNDFAEGAGTSVNMPFWKDSTDQDDEIQVENTGPSDQGATAGVMVAPILNRVTKNGATALSGQVAGDDPLPQIISILADRRAMQRQKTLVAILRGAFGTGSVALSGAAALSANRIVAADESGVGATAAQTLSGAIFISAKALMGEQANMLSNGAIFVHPNVYAGLELADLTLFKTGIPSALPFAITTYRGIPIFTSEALVRAGTTDGFVYDTYIMAPNTIAHGEAPQLADTGDTVAVSAIQFDSDKDKNNAYVYDRTRFLLHINGLKWIGTPAGQSATNVELAVPASWNLVYSSANRVGIVAIQTNA